MNPDIIAPPQIVPRKNLPALIEIKKEFSDRLPDWLEAYFQYEVTTSASSRQVQRRDLNLFLDFMRVEEKDDHRARWTPRLSKAFQEWLRAEMIIKFEKGKKGQPDKSFETKRYGERTVNRIMAHLKTFSKWVHKLRPFPLGDPMARLKLLSVGHGLEVERAVTAAERRRILDAADFLLKNGGISTSRSRYAGKERPQRKSYRPYRNRAIVYVLLGTGMRRAAVTKINAKDVDMVNRVISVVEKGGVVQKYQVSQEAVRAIQDYVQQEREADAEVWRSNALFLAAGATVKGNGRLDVCTVNRIWNGMCHQAEVAGKTPHSARHAMGKHIMEKTGNVAAVQRQLGHRNVAYSMQYARITAEELGRVIDDQ